MTNKNLPKAPEYEIHYGMVTTKCENEMIDWIQNLINLCSFHNLDSKNVAETIYEEVRSLGYSEGYDSCNNEMND